MPLIELTSNTQARRLELENLERAGDKAIRAELDKVPEIVEDDNYIVEKVVLDSSRDENVQHIIDREIKKHSGTVYQKHLFLYKNSTSGKVKNKRLFKVSEHSMTIYRDFTEVIEGTYSLEEDIKDKKDELAERAENEIQEHREEIEKLKAFLKELKQLQGLEEKEEGEKIKP